MKKILTISKKNWQILNLMDLSFDKTKFLKEIFIVCRSFRKPCIYNLLPTYSHSATARSTDMLPSSTAFPFSKKFMLIWYFPMFKLTFLIVPLLIYLSCCFFQCFQNFHPALNRSIFHWFVTFHSTCVVY